jgi:hypothetical protein
MMFLQAMMLDRLGSVRHNAKAQSSLAPYAGGEAMLYLGFD